MDYQIPFNKPFMAGKELYYIAQSVLSGQVSGDGVFSRKCQEFLQKRFSSLQILLTTSCTSALEMAAMLCDIGKHDEVIMPSYTFVSTANAFYLRGATIKFVDIRPDTLNMDESKLEELVSERTKAIVPVHYAGVACDMDVICEVAHENRLFIIEDAAQGVNAKYKGAYLGTIGHFGAYSFHETKNFMCGEGGAIAVNRAEFIERAEILREKGTNRSQFFRGQVDKYTWVDLGSSYVPSDILAAFLYAQLEELEEITLKRRKLFELYYKLLQPLVGRGLVMLPTIPETCESNYHMFYILLADYRTRTALIEHLNTKGILAVFHYIPLHTSPVGESMGFRRGMLPITEELSERLLRLPFYFELSDDKVRLVVKEIFSFFGIKVAAVV